jgi:hypothetical protein
VETGTDYAKAGEDLHAAGFQQVGTPPPECIRRERSEARYGPPGTPITSQTSFVERSTLHLKRMQLRVASLPRLTKAFLVGIRL